MEITGEHEFRGPRELLWELLLDPETLAGALPGVERFEEVAPDTYEATMRVGIASVRGTYRGRVEVSERKPPESYRLRIDGAGKPGGARADAFVELCGGDGVTTMRYRAEVKARGAIARLGGRLLGGVARLLIGQFVKSIERQVDDRAAEAAPVS